MTLPILLIAVVIVGELLALVHVVTATRRDRARRASMRRHPAGKYTAPNGTTHSDPPPVFTSNEQWGGTLVPPAHSKDSGRITAGHRLLGSLGRARRSPTRTTISP